MGQKKGYKHTSETKKKISDGVRGFKHTEEAKRKISLGKMGDKNPMKRESVRKKVSESLKGKKPWNKGLKGVQKGWNNGKKWSKEQREKCSGKNSNRWNGGKPKCSDCGITVKMQKAVRCLECYRKNNKLENHFNWQGGKSFEPYGLEFNKELKEKIRQRDNYTCQECGKDKSELKFTLSVHHIDYDKKNNCEQNLISLCRSCHTKTNYSRDMWTDYYKRKML